jgi:hypothetical protein
MKESEDVLGAINVKVINSPVLLTLAIQIEKLYNFFSHYKKNLNERTFINDITLIGGKEV